MLRYMLISHTTLAAGRCRPTGLCSNEDRVGSPRFWLAAAGARFGQQQLPPRLGTGRVAPTTRLGGIEKVEHPSRGDTTGCPCLETGAFAGRKASVSLTNTLSDGRAVCRLNSRSGAGTELHIKPGLRGAQIRSLVFLGSVPVVHVFTLRVIPS